MKRLSNSLWNWNKRCTQSKGERGWLPISKKSTPTTVRGRFDCSPGSDPNSGPVKIRKLVHEHIGLPDWLMEACRSAVGDSSETWALLFPNQSKTCELSLAQTIESTSCLWVILMNQGSTFILEALDQLSAPEKQVYFKIIRGGFRMGVKKALVIKGLAAASGLEEAVLAHRLMGGLDATPEAFQQLIHPESDQEHALRAYPFFLAPPLEGEAHQLGDRKDWAANGNGTAFECNWCGATASNCGPGAKNPSQDKSPNWCARPERSPKAPCSTGNCCSGRKANPNPLLNCKPVCIVPPRPKLSLISLTPRFPS